MKLRTHFSWTNLVLIRKIQVIDNLRNSAESRFVFVETTDKAVVYTVYLKKKKKNENGEYLTIWRYTYKKGHLEIL